MLRVASNGAFESLGTLLRLCEELDVEVLDSEELE
jgi:EKC/KEOPS complex subunit PCC1/LAGE3